MNDPFNHFSGTRFLRRQPEHLRRIPWAGERPTWSQIWRLIGYAVLWIALLLVWFVIVAAVMPI